MVKRLTLNEFIRRANIVHNGKYDYSESYYVNMRTDICIICPEHGEFYQKPNNHLNLKQGCIICSGKFHKTTDQFIEDARKIHGDNYDYSEVEYINCKVKVCIKCLYHGNFYQTPDAHLNQKQGCPRCSKAGYSKISIQFLDELSHQLKVDIQHAENIGEYEIYDEVFKCKYKADGYFEKNNKKYVVEFHGDYWHGNPKVFNPNSKCKIRSLTFEEIYQKTMDRMFRIKALGYEVYYIWERDFKQYLLDNGPELSFYYVVL